MDRYILEKLTHRVKELENDTVRETQLVSPVYYTKEDDSKFREPGYDDSDWICLNPGQEWEGHDSIIWIRGTVKIPEHLRGKALDLHVEAGPKESMDIKAEALLYVEGKETCAFDNWHSRMRLQQELTDRGEFSIALRVWSGMNEPGQMRHFQGIWLEYIDEVAEKYYFLAKTVLETIRELEAKDYRRITLLEILDRSFMCIDYLAEDREAFYQSVGEAYTYLSECLEREFPEEGNKPVVAVCGHTHIDMAWLWRLCHTTDKGARSFSTVLHLMDRYPEYKFSQSSPLIYEMVREKYPELYERIKEKIQEGRWEITGGMWVEPDTNIPSGESLVRQLLLGKRYMKKEFGKETTVLWLPDVFGYSWALPQILKKSGIRLFWTNKMSWNQYNRIPYDTFQWKGLDGSMLLTQLGTCPERDVTWGSTYNGVIAPWEVKGTWDQYQQKDLNQEVLMPFGWGDGGGGPTREMLESYEVMQNLPGLPKVKMKHIEEFARDLEENLAEKEAPVWDGELYFEYHRGTYTSQAFIKRENRKAEILYHDIELFSALRDTLTDTDEYPLLELEKNWKKICTNQFHDIIPGSSIAEVYEDAAKSYGEIRAAGSGMLDRALHELARNIKVQVDGIVVFNSLSWERDGIFEVEGVQEGIVLMDGERELPAQYSRRNGNLCAEYLAEQIPSCGYKVLTWKPGITQVQTACQKWDRILDTRFYRIEFNESGQISRIFDKEYKREVLSKGGLGNELCVFEDKPHQFEAWNTEIYAYQKYKSITKLVQAELTEEGPIKTVVSLEYSFGRSTIRQNITVYQNSREICFDTWCDWHEKQALLKTAFDVDIRATQAVYDIQFGNLKRPTHSNTSWDYAQFEVCAHKWADLSEGNYGVTLMNDCKYGYDIKGSKMRLTLIKTSSYPDPDADLGDHVFSYALLPHGFSWKEANSDKRAYEFNMPLHIRAVKQNLSGSLLAAFSFVCTDQEHVVIETVKKTEDGEGWIIRAYECMQYRGPVSFYFGRTLRSGSECSLMEEEIAPAWIEGNCLTSEMTPYEIKTFKVIFDDEGIIQ